VNQHQNQAPVYFFGVHSNGNRKWIPLKRTSNIFKMLNKYIMGKKLEDIQKSNEFIKHNWNVINVLMEQAIIWDTLTEEKQSEIILNLRETDIHRLDVFRYVVNEKKKGKFIQVNDQILDASYIYSEDSNIPDVKEAKIEKQ
jgi:hypothetical protein